MRPEWPPNKRAPHIHIPRRINQKAVVKSDSELGKDFLLYGTRPLKNGSINIPVIPFFFPISFSW